MQNNRIGLKFFREFIVLALLVLVVSLPVKADNVHCWVVDQTSPDWSAETLDFGQAGGRAPITALRLDVDEGMKPRGGIIYKIHQENVGWSEYGGNGAVVGNDTYPIQALRVNLTGSLRYEYDVYYRVHYPNIGWTGWARNNEACGSEGLGRNATIISIGLTRKGVLPEGQIGGAFTQAKWTWPVPGHYSISSEFGPRNGAHHDGFDIPAPGGTPIVSAKSGIVKMAAPDGNFGNCVCVQNDSGETVYYAHMSSINAQVDQRVKAGQIIGRVGTTGNSTGNHLHMEIYSDWEENTNPRTYY